MLRNVKDLRGYAIRATDGVIGKVDDFYFDDEDWGIRYLVVDTGSWLSGRKVLISPIALGHAGWMAQAASGSPDEGAGGTQSRHRHQETGLTAARSSSTSGTTGIRTTGAARACGAWARIRAA